MLGVRPRTAVVRRATSGLAYLNLGCGRHYSREWNNVDLFRAPGVLKHSVTDPLPYPDGVFDAAYSSHVIEHLSLGDAERFVAEIHRVLRPGAPVRLATPDLERICRDYVARLEAVVAHPEREAWRRYHWIKLELIDQMVREEPGGRMLRDLRAGLVDPADVKERLGDEIDVTPSPDGRAGAGLRAALSGVKRRLRPAGQDPRSTGELHRWLHDRASLQHLLESAGFVDFRVTTFEASAIPDWALFDLDRSPVDPSRARKPDSIFVEASRPA